MRVAADDNIYTVAAQKVGRSALCGIGMALVFVAPMHEGDDAVGSVAVYGGEVACHDGSVDTVYNTPFGNGQAVCPVGVVYNGECDTVARDILYVVQPHVGAVAEDSRAADASAVEYSGGGSYACAATVTAVVVCHDGQIYLHVAHGVGDGGGGAEARISRIGPFLAQRGLEVYDCQIGLPRKPCHMTE